MAGRPGYPRIPMEIDQVIDEAFTAILEDTVLITSALGDAQHRVTVLWDEIRNR